MGDSMGMWTWGPKIFVIDIHIYIYIYIYISKLLIYYTLHPSAISFNKSLSSQQTKEPN